MIGNVNPKASWLTKNKYWDKNIEEKIRDYLVRQVRLPEELKMELFFHEMISKKRFAVLDNSTFREIGLGRSKYLN